MELHPSTVQRDNYLVSRRQAWFAFAMTFALMLFDYMDRQVIVSLFPHLKAAWKLSDKELGALVSVISMVVAVGGIPVAAVADRFSRVRSIVVMGTVWSLACIACMFARNYGQLFVARAAIGAGETGYGAVGGALISGLFPTRLRSVLMGAFFAAASLGSVLGVLLGGVIAARYGWQAAFGVVGVPGLVLALAYRWVPDYRTVGWQPEAAPSARPPGRFPARILSTLRATPTLLWCCLGAALQCNVIASIWGWMPSYLNRYLGLPTDQAAIQAAGIVLVGALGTLFWSALIDRLALRRARAKIEAVALLCALTAMVFVLAFAALPPGPAQVRLILVGGFLMTSLSGPITAVAYDVLHPGVRSTGAAVLSLAQNLFGLATGAFLTGLISDLKDLQFALAVMPGFGLLAALALLQASRSYEADCGRVAGVRLQVQA